MAEQKKRGGGPKTTAGKARSSQNSLKHGGRSATLILPHECQEDYDRMAEGWQREFEPEGYQEERLVEILVRSDWFFRRTEQRWMAAEAAKEEQHQLELLQRYKTTAERSFYRAWQALRGLEKDLMRKDDRYSREADRSRRFEADLKERDAQLARFREQAQLQAKAQAKPCSPGKKKNEKLEVLEQWVEVRAGAAGETVTALFPSNEELQKIAEKRERLPDLVYRRLFFVGGVPHEYQWTTDDARALEWGGLGTQRMVWEKWREQIAKEMLTPGGHLQPCGGNMPRPHERGGCECAVCVKNQWMLKAAGFK